MESVDCDRRRLLKLGGAGAALALAGCIETVDDTSDSMPPYADDLVTDENGNVIAFYTTWGEDSGFGDGEGDGNGGGIIGGGNDTIGGGNGTIGGGESAGEFEDPLLMPLEAPLALGLFAGFTLGFTPLSPVLGLDGESADANGTDNETEGFDTEIAEMLMTASGDSFAFVMRGDIDTDEIDELLTEGSNTSLTVTYSEAGESNGYTRYEADTGSDGDDDDNVTVDIDMDAVNTIAVGSDGIIFGASDAIDRLTGDGASPVEESDTLAWLLETAGDGDFGVTMYAPEGFDEDAISDNGSQNDTSDGERGDAGGGVDVGPGLGNETEDVLAEFDATVTGISGMMRAESEEEASVDLAMTFESDLDSEARETIESEVGTEASDVSVEFDGDRVAISGTYTDESF